jgi:hypothetical protein
MMTTAVRMPRTVPYRDGDVMGVTFAVAPRRGDAPPRAADACRVGHMRRIAAARLRYCRLEAMTDDVLLAVSELLTSALQYGRGTHVGVRLYLTATHLHLEVQDGSRELPVLRKAAPLDEDGRGLFLVAAVADAWGVSHGGTVTWCSVPLNEGTDDMQPATASAPVLRKCSPLPPASSAGNPAWLPEDSDV